MTTTQPTMTTHGYTIDIQRIEWDGKFTHWECDVFIDGVFIGGGTAPTHSQATALAHNIAADRLGNQWFDDDANEPVVN